MPRGGVRDSVGGRSPKGTGLEVQCTINGTAHDLRRGKMRVRQTTLNHPVSMSGIGVHSGLPVHLILKPAPAETGIVFRRTDLAKGHPAGADVVAARFDAVSDTRLGTTITNAHGTSVSTVEHLLAALVGLGVDNAEIEIDAPEVPIMDGSAAPFVFLIECAGLRTLPVLRRVLKIVKPVMVEEQGKRAELLPYDGFAIDLEINFSSAAVRRQRFEITLNDPAAFKAQVARARTFGFLHEVEYLRSQGLARGGSLENAVVIDGDVVLNKEGLRFSDEFVRHKVLDVIGDLALAGAPVMGRFRGSCSGHGLNNRLLRAVFASPESFTLTVPDMAAAAKTRAPLPRAVGLAVSA